MADWRTMHEAPRDQPIKLFLPGVTFEADEHGRPKPDTIAHGECVGLWDAAQSHWVDRDSGGKVYPSQWQPLD